MKMNRKSGYTLVELAIVLTVGGLILTTAGMSLHIYKKNQEHQETANNISIVTAALNNYLVKTGAYPCPALADVPRSDPQYGVAGNCADVSIPDGSCGEGKGHGYCIQQSNRQDAKPPPGWTGRVRRGGVPFRTLGIPEYSAVDGYEDRLQYAVTEALAVPATYSQRAGGIDVQDGRGNILVKPLNGATGGTTHYVILSNGPDKVGAYSFESGKMVSRCPAIGTTLDAANCQTEGLLPPAIYIAANYADAKGKNHFDDMVFYYSAVQSPVWRITGSLGLDITDPVQAGDSVTAGKVGIGVNTSTSGSAAALQVNGNVLARNNIHVNQLCAAGSQGACAAAAPLSSTCPPGQVATGFNAGHISCVKDMRVMCPSGQYMTGIDAEGNILCEAAVGCPATRVQTCWNPSSGNYDNYTIHAAPLGVTFTTPVDGDSFTQTYQCRTTAGSGQWIKTGTAGVCLCTAASNVPVTQSCAQYMSDNCPDCWTGVANFKQSTSCPGGATTQSYVSNTCRCRPFTLTYARPCADGMTGEYIYTQNYTCDPANPSAAGTWGPALQAGSCVCQPQVLTQTITCQSAGYSAGYTGSVTQTRQLSCPRGNGWVPWTTTADSCACKPVTQIRTIGCAPPQTGTQTQKQTFNCTTNSWGPWVTDSSSCSR